MGGSLAFVQADAYIKQTRHPLAIYTLRTALANLMILGLASISLIGWVIVVLPENIGLCWLAALLIFPIVCHGRSFFLFLGVLQGVYRIRLANNLRSIRSA